MNFTSVTKTPAPDATSLRSKSRLGMLACSAALAASAALSGCGVLSSTFGKQALDDQAYLVGAMPLESRGAYPLLKDVPMGDDGKPVALSTLSKLDVITSIANDSQTKCLAFLQELSAAETGADTSLDIATTTLSALSTAFSPAGTKTALSAASTVTGGMKTAIDSDFYAKTAIANYAKAIQGTYFKDMKDLREQLKNDQANLDVGLQYGAIGNIHAECTLGGAQAHIDANLQPSGSQPPDNSGSPGQPPVKPLVAPESKPSKLYGTPLGQRY